VTSDSGDKSNACTNQAAGSDKALCARRPSKTLICREQSRSRCSSVATGGGHGGTCPLTPVGPGHGNCRNPMRKKLRWVWGVPDHLGQTSYAEIRILVTKYISKLDEIQNTNHITCHVFNCVFQILVFQLVDNSANKHAEQRRPTFFSCFTSGSCTLAEYRPPVPPLTSKSWLRHCRNGDYSAASLACSAG